MSCNSGLLLEDGTWFSGEFWGSNESSGEVVFNTSMTGYQEVITDPSYCNQIIVMTYPLIGNYGVSHKESEASRIVCKGLIVKEFFEFQETSERQSLQHFLEDHQLSVLSGVDTRALTRKIRQHGTMKGMILERDSNEVHPPDYDAHLQTVPMSCLLYLLLHRVIRRIFYQSFP